MKLQSVILIVLMLLFGTHAALAEGGKHAFTLVIDAGHGGHDSGALGGFSKEKTINLNVALAFGRLVEENCPDVKIVYTRKRDVFIPLQRRADIANQNKADLFISIHTNALPGGRQAYGPETYTLGMARAGANLDVAKRENSVITLESDYQRTYEGFDPNKAESYVIFEIMQDHYMKQSVDLAKCIQKSYKQAGRPDKGVHQAGFLVLRNTSMPSVLTELGFITTPSEEEYLNSEKGITEMSRSIYNGFLAFRRQYDKTAHTLPPDLPAKVEESKPHLSTTPENKDEVAVVPVPTVPTERKVETPEAKPQPAAKETKPAAKESKPAAKESKPAAKESKPAAKEPKPAAKESKPAAKETKPAAKETKPAAKETKPAAKETKPAAKESKPAAKGKETQQKKATPKGPKIVYRVQVGAGKKEISPKDSQFKGLAITRVKEGSLYKYFYGNYSTYAEAQKGLRTAKEKIPGAYLVAYVDGKPVPVQEARNLEKKK